MFNIMDNNLKGLIYIVLGGFIVFMAFDFILKLITVIFGFYLIYKGLQLRNAQNVLFYVHRFRNRF